MQNEQRNVQAYGRDWKYVENNSNEEDRMNKLNTYFGRPPVVDGEDYLSLENKCKELENVLSNLLAMLPPAQPKQTGRIPPGFCYVRWEDINEARAVLAKYK